jgi:thioredoxin reductase
MEKDREIIIIGGGNVGKTCAIELAKRNNICDLHSVVDSQFTEPKEVFKITKLHYFEEPCIDTNEPIINYQKHYKTCLKNRKARKKRKRR